ncbi:MAG: ATP-dependent DNA helicase RecG [Vicinamibacterales bacterium]
MTPTTTPPPSGLERDVSTLAGVGPRRASAFHQVGIRTLDDLLHRFPLRYEDRRHRLAIGDLQPGTVVSIEGTITDARLRPTRRPGFSVMEVVVGDGTGTVSALWFNQRYLQQVLRRDAHIVLYGKVEPASRGAQLTNPDFEILEADAAEVAEPSLHTRRIVPVYEKIGPIGSKMQRALVWQALQAVEGPLADPLPSAVRRRRDLIDPASALRLVHFPAEDQALDALEARRSPAHRRLIFEELFAFQLGLAYRQAARARVKKPWTIRIDDALRERLRAMLPFSLTPDQRQALKAIVDDMRSPAPMNRLLQGDVGSGKTIVAALAAMVAIANGVQVAFMAPTEILAEQHYLTLRSLFEPAGVTVELLTGEQPAKSRRARRDAIARGEAGLVVGTHALAQTSTVFQRLGLVIIDEQHRFGVVQRALLRAKGHVPDVLVMTATPIPRTLALTSYGDLDVSVIRSMPPGRTPVRTTVRPEHRRAEAHAFLRSEVARGRQAYIVYPLVEESDKLDVRAATEMADRLAAEVLPEFTVGLLHGRLRQEEKARVMAGFVAGAVQVLVATTVVEVGVNVPNATVMVVEHAERFGLAQLHQLRGRVGRGVEPSSCILLYQPPLTELARERLRAIAETADGFVLAERDLEIRGPGDFFGTRQSGLPLLRVGDLVRDRDLLEEARDDAWAHVASADGQRAVAAWAEEAWAHRFGFIEVG